MPSRGLLVFRGASNILILLLMTIIQMGCGTYKSFKIAKEEKPVVLFERYTIDVTGATTADSLYGIEVAPHFIDPVPGTADINKIPVLTIDSLCFECTALSVPNCYKLAPMGDESKPRDLFTNTRGFLMPGTFRASEVAVIPANCRNLVARFRARLTDRVTGEEIAQEWKTVILEVKKRLYFNVLY